MSEAKQFDISKKAVIAAFQAVKELEEKYEQEKTASENVTESVTTDITDGISADSENTPDMTDEPDIEQTTGMRI